MACSSNRYERSAGLWRGNNGVRSRGSVELRLIPTRSALIVGDAVHNGGDAIRWQRIHHRPDRGGSDRRTSGNRRTGRDWMIAAPTVVAAAIAPPPVDVHVADVDRPVDVSGVDVPPVDVAGIDVAAIDVATVN